MLYPSKLSTPHLLGIKNLSIEDIDIIFKTTDEFRQIIERPIKKVPSLRDITIANLFFENSTRTRLSFELAAKRLSADLINFTASNSSLKKGETLLDTVNNILAMKVDMLIIRHEKAGVPHFLSKNVNAHIINAGDGKHEHPTQALLDCYSLRQKFGSLKNLNVGILGDILHSRVALSNIIALRKMEANVKVCGPPTLMPTFLNELNIKYEKNLSEFLNWCDAVNVLRIQTERQTLQFFPSLVEYAALYGINSNVVKKLSKPITILHPGPINRGVEISSEVADSSDAIILDQVTNGIAIRMAILYLLAGNKPEISK